MRYYLIVKDAQGQYIGSAWSPSASVIRKFGESQPAGSQLFVDIMPKAPQEPSTMSWEQFLEHERQATAKA